MTLPSEPLYSVLKTTQWKVCPICLETKTLDAFTTDKRNKDGKGANCRKCEMKRNKERNTRKALAVYDENTIKVCLQCLVPKPILSFSKKPSGKYGVDARCKECCYINHKIWREANFDRESIKRREEYAKNKLDPNYLKRRGAERRLALLGVTSEWIREKLESQNGGCGICGSNDPGNKKSFAVDHNHDCCGPKRSCEKCRRDLLCLACNTKLGVLENPEWMAKAMGYLEKHRNNRSLSSDLSLSLWRAMFSAL